MSAIPGTVINSRIVPTDTLDNYATHDAQFGRDGWRSVSSIAERDAIFSARRVEGMAVWVQGVSATYQLVGGLNNSNWTLLSWGGGSSWLPTEGTGMSITAPDTSSYLFSVNDYISGTEVASISAGLDTRSTSNTNSINTLFSTYTNSTTTQAISAGLQSQILGLQSQILATSGAYATTDDIINLDLDLQSQITISKNSINTLYSTYTNISTTQAISAGLQSQISQITSTINNQGTSQLDTSNILFTITHSVLTSLNSKFPIITLQIPSSGSNLILASITNRTLSSFDVILSQVPNISGYYVNWLLAG